MQEDHEAEKAGPEEHQLEQAPLVQLHGCNDASDDGGGHAERQLAVELLDAVGADQRRVGAVANIGRQRLRLRGRLDSVYSVG